MASGSEFVVLGSSDTGSTSLEGSWKLHTSVTLRLCSTIISPHPNSK